MNAIEADRIVCDWSIKFSVPLTEEQLNALVDAIAEFDAPDGRVCEE